MKPLIMGIINVTPDSFSDGGMYLSPDSALKQAERLVEEGADILDIGGESSRPGATPVASEDEIKRVIPVIEMIAKRFPVRISVDTTKSEVAEVALATGASVINDISGGADIKMAGLLKKHPQANIILMHMRGTPVTMQVQPFYPRGVVEEVKTYLQQRLAAFGEAGVTADRVWVDPGIGFGKTLTHNLELLRRLDELQALGSRVLVGTSRKSFLAGCLGDPNTTYEEREAGTVASNLWAYEKGASVFRVHQVGEMKRALTTWEAIRNGR